MGARLQPERIIDVTIPEVFGGLFEPWRIKAFRGGRGRGASWSFAQALLVKGTEQPLRILCTREHQSSIRDSVHRLLSDQIERLGLHHYYKVNKNEITSYLGGLFIFKGLRYNVSEIKSTEGIDIAWVEEAEKCSDESWRTLIPTIRKKNSEIWVNFNVESEQDPTHQRFGVPGLRADALVVHSTYRDNRYFPEELRKEMEYDRKTDPDAAAHTWDGLERRSSEAEVMHGKWEIATFSPEAHWLGPYHGADWGFSTDPTVAVRMWVDPKANKLYVEYEVWGLKVATAKLPEFFEHIPAIKNHRITADNARPETISHMVAAGFNMVPCTKYKGSVEEGVGFLRSFERIVIHERCKHTIHEAKNYKFKLDKLTDLPTTEIIDKHNHCWDSIRYGLDAMIMVSKQAGRPSVRSLS